MAEARVHIGVIAFDSPGPASCHPLIKQVTGQLTELLGEWLPEFDWQIDPVRREIHPSSTGSHALPLLEFAAHQKLLRQWDFALVITQEPLVGAGNEIILGAVSSVLESSVLSLEALLDRRNAETALAIQLHLLGRLLDLPEAEEGVMQRIQLRQPPALQLFTESELTRVRTRLHEVADLRIEEKTSPPRHAFSFFFQTIWADPSGILQDILAYRPWKQPFRLAKLSASSIATMIILMLTAEVWEIGVHMPWPLLAGLAILSITAATLLVFYGRQLFQLCQQFLRTEQNTRARVVLLSCLGLGMVSLYVVLWLVAFGIALAVPDSVHDGWLQRDVGLDGIARFCALVSGLGVAAAALGGNLEDPEDLKYELFVDSTI